MTRQTGGKERPCSRPESWSRSAGTEPRSTRPRAPHSAAPRRENDEGGRFTLRPRGRFTAAFPLIRRAVNVLRHRRRVRGGAPATGAVAGATRLAEGSVRRRAECVFTPSPPRLDGSLPHQRSLLEGGPAPRRGGGASVRRPPVCRSGGRHPSPRHSPDEPLWSDATGRPLRPCFTLTPTFRFPTRTVGSASTLRRQPTAERGLDGLPAGTDGPERPLRGGCPGCAHPNPPRCPHWASKPGGRSHPRPRSADRHRRSAGRDATASG